MNDFFWSFVAVLVGVGLGTGLAEMRHLEPEQPEATTQFLECPNYTIDRLRDGTIRIRIPPETD